MTKTLPTLTKKQEEMLYLLRLDGLAREIEMHESEAAYKKAKEIENAVNQYVIDHNNYVVCEDRACGDTPGERITREFDTFMMDETIFVNDYLPKVKDAYMSLYGIENPLNFVYSAPMRERAFKAKKNYLRLAVDFLKICGAPQAAELEKAVNGYLRPDLERRLMDLTDSFISGKAVSK